MFLVCANIYNCVVSIQANNNDEYRIYPENVSDNPTIKFARVESSKYVCLKRDQEIFGKFRNFTHLFIQGNKNKLCDFRVLFGEHWPLQITLWDANKHKTFRKTHTKSTNTSKLYNTQHMFKCPPRVNRGWLFI